MNELTLTQLKIIVERAVRPVRSSLERKCKIREELLAHVSGVFDEEFGKLGAEQAALARTVERFGQAAELTSQLQASIPRGDAFVRFVEHVADFRLGESTLRRASRLALIAFLIAAASLTPPFLMQNRLREWPIIPAIAILVFCFTFVNHWMRGALCGPAGRSWLRALLVGSTSSLLIPGVTFGVCLAYSGEVWSSMTDVLGPDMSEILVLSWAMLFTGASVAVIAYATEKRLRWRREWESLQIN